MKLHDLKPQEGSKKDRRRLGRGISAGQGKTAGGNPRPYHQGGNLPFFRRLPFMRGKGFTPFNRVVFNEINLDQLASFKPDSDVTPESLAEARLLRDPRNPVVILGRGELEIALKVHVHRITRGARAKIEAAGGSVELIA
jgi:large subunit ribosomal protein L15